MILLTILTIIILILVVIMIAALSALGASAIIIFGDVIVCVLVLLWLIKKIISRKKTKR